MAQVVATTRSIHSSILSSPSSGSLQDRVDKLLKPSTFSSKFLSSHDKKKIISSVSSHRNTHIVAAAVKRSAEPEVIPVSPEDVPKVCTTYLIFGWIIYQLTEFITLRVRCKHSCHGIASKVRRNGVRNCIPWITFLLDFSYGKVRELHFS